MAQAHEIDAMAARHGFRLSGFRSFEQPVTDEQIAAVREKARKIDGRGCRPNSADFYFPLRIRATMLA